jgi:hypothetical protein
MRFYNIDGIEEDLQEPSFFIDEDELTEYQDSIQEMLNNYV